MSLSCLAAPQLKKTLAAPEGSHSFSVPWGSVLGATFVQAAVSPPTSAQTSGHQEHVATTTNRVFLTALLTSVVKMSLEIFDRPGVAKALLETALLLINYETDITHL